MNSKKNSCRGNYLRKYGMWKERASAFCHQGAAGIDVINYLSTANQILNFQNLKQLNYHKNIETVWL